MVVKKIVAMNFFVAYFVQSVSSHIIIKLILIKTNSSHINMESVILRP